VAYAFSAEDPESLRGPQFAYAWIDEYAKFKQAEEVMDMLSFGLRLGDNPRIVITTTPRPTAALKKLMQDKTTAITRSKTSDNAANLSHHFIKVVNERYAGTRLGRQELEGELMEDRVNALWSRALIDECRIALMPQFKRVVVAVDPPATSKASSDKCGLVVVGLCEDNRMVVVEDATQGGLKPLEWAAKAVRLYHKHQADRIIAEVNQGGEMVTTILREIDPMIPVEGVHATRGKYLRAEPVAALYQQGRVLHAGAFPALEDEMCDFTAEGLSSGRSPDRLDALVWAVTGLMKGRGEPKIRRL
jgi:phage terminase large subunit-like protein